MPGPGGQEEPTWMEDEVFVRLKTFAGADEAGAQAAAEGFRNLNASLLSFDPHMNTRATS